MSMLSGGIGIPEGAFKRLSNKQAESALEFIIQNQLNLVQVIQDNQGNGTGDQLLIGALVDDDGTVLTSKRITSASRLDTGIYEVNTSVNFATEVDGTPRCWPQVTPQGLIRTAGTSQVTEYPGLTTVNWNYDQNGTHYDTQRGRVWVVDIDHDTTTNETTGEPDRIGVFRIDSETWEYITLPTIGTDKHSFATKYKCSISIMDIAHRAFYVQARNEANDEVTTLIYSLDTLELLQDTYDDIVGHGQTFYFFIIGVDSANDRLLLWGDSNYLCWGMNDNGTVDTSLGGVARSGNTGFRSAICDNNGHFWFHDGTPNPDDWQQIVVTGSGATLTINTRDAGADGLDTRIYAFNAVQNAIYYLDNARNDLWKILCDSPYTVTELTASDWPSYAGSGHLTSPLEINCLAWSYDYYRLIGVRGGGTAPMCVYIIDPTDGTVDAHYELEDLYVQNFFCDTIAVQPGVFWSLSSNRIMQFNFTGDTEETDLSVYKPVTPSVRMVDANTARVELFLTANSVVRQDNAFYIEFPGELA